MTKSTMYLAMSLARLVLGAFLLGVIVPQTAAGQRGGVPTVADIEARISALQAGTAEGKEAVIETYQQALAAMGRTGEARARAQKFLSAAAEAPAMIVALQAELSNFPSEPELQADPAQSLQQVVSLLEQAQADLAAGRAQLADLDDIARHRTDRRGELPAEIAAGQQALATTRETLAALPAGPETDARATLLRAQVDELQANLTALEAERDTYEARRELLPLRRDRAVRAVARAERVTTFWTERADARRAAEGEAAAKDATQRLGEVAKRFPELVSLAAATQELAKLRTGENGIPKRISRAQAALGVTRGRVDEVRRRSRSARRRVAAGGLTEGMGLILRRDYEWLPQAAPLKRDAALRDKMLSEAQLELIVIEEERRAVGDIAGATARLVRELGAGSPTEEFANATRELLTTQREAHDSALANLETLSSTFYEHKELSQTLVSESREYRAYIEKHILWVRSSAANPLASMLAAPANATRVALSFWSPSILVDLNEHAAKHWGRLLSIALLYFGLMAVRRPLRRKRQELGVLVRSFRTDRYLYTVRAFIQSILLALPMPLLAWTLGWSLASSQNDLPRAAGSALCEVSYIWFMLRLLWGLASEKGVGAAHFRWSNSSLKALRKELRWFEPTAILLGFCAITLNGQGTAEWADSVGRLCFVAAMVALAFFARRLLREGSAMWAIAPNAGKGLLGRTHAIWSLLAYGIPAVLALMALAGYYYTALQFELRLRYSIGFAVVLVIVNAFLLRWLFMTRRRLAVRQALEAKARKEQEETVEGATESGVAALDTDKVDIPAIDAQTRQLFKASITVATLVGLYFIWANVFPALQGLDRVQLLPKLAIVSAEAEADAQESALAPLQAPNSAAGIPSSGIPAPQVPATGNADDGATVKLGLPAKLTLADVLLAIVFAVLTSVAARNLPALLELAVLQRLPLDGGSRYAVTTIVRYLILIIGVTVTSGALGIGWQKVQWLAAALTFGLAFGLQEIFANFVSGLIILIERPIRVGDVVTVGDTEGRVTQLRMRATTLMDWNRRELLVPNKEFITGSVINWTLSDPITRIIIPVGIAYGSDTAKARRLLLETARKNPLVQDDPQPSAIFRAFGASSLDFELRIFVGNRDLWPEVVDSLHTQIDNAFRRAKIEIAFPQQDIHLRSVQGLKEVQLKADDEGQPPQP